MADFTIAPDYVIEEEPTFDTTVTEFESGSEQRQGLRGSALRRWKLKFFNRAQTEFEAVRSFFLGKKGRNTSFLWENPFDEVEYLVRFADDNYVYQLKSPEVYDFSFSFQQVLSWTTTTTSTTSSSTSTTTTSTSTTSTTSTSTTSTSTTSTTSTSTTSTSTTSTTSSSTSTTTTSTSTTSTSSSTTTTIAWTLPTELDLTYGTIDSGSLTDVYTDDGNNLVINEVTGAPGFEYSFTFENVPNLGIRVVVYGYYNGTSGHDVKLLQWDYFNSEWSNVTVNAQDFPEDVSEQQYSFDLLTPNSRYILNGRLRLRVCHVDNGNITHDFITDLFVLDTTSTTTTSTTSTSTTSTSTSTTSTSTTITSTSTTSTSTTSTSSTSTTTTT